MDLRLESEDKDRKLVNIYRNIFKINSKKDAKSLNGRGINTSYEHTNKIMFPKHYRRI